MNFSINDACWDYYPQDALFDMMEAHPLLFPRYKRPSGRHTPDYRLNSRKDQPYTDDFGCVWTTAINGITGTVTGHPLADWAAFENWECPNPDICTGIGPIDRGSAKSRAKKQKAEGKTVSAGLRHGHTFLQLSDLRGYENLMYDFADEPPVLNRLIERLERFNTEIVKHWLEAGADIMGFPDDLGMQQGPMLSPAHFRKYIKPSYRRMMKLARDKGAAIHMHSDGDIRLLADDLTGCGVDVLNLQDLVNGIDWIAERFAGKVCIELDIDRQNITPHGTPTQIDALIREEAEKLGSPQGGLMMVYGLYPGVPLENAAAVMDAMEKYAGYYS
ncbi:MAG: hypothetical protein FWF08_04665 [Oscillospiraceae bacterium]|nr:hypothetical protein [Oscillospiraceae bacterium]